MKKRGLMIWVLFFIFMFMTTSRSMAQDEVRVGYLKLVGALPAFAALEKGYFQEQGLKAIPNVFESGTILVDALIAGRIDMTAGNSIVTHWMAEQNMPGTYKTFIIYECSGTQDVTFTLMVAKKSSLKGVIDLKGKKVGTFPGVASLSLAKAVLRSYFNPDKEVILIEIPPGNIVQALAADQIDAYFAPEPFGMMAEAKGVGRHLVRHPLKVLNLKHGFPGSVFTFGTKFLKEKPLVAKKTKAACDKGIDFIRAHETEARKYLVKYTGLPEQFAMKIPFEQWVKAEQYKNPSYGQPYFDVLEKEGLFKKHVDISQLYYQE